MVEAPPPGLWVVVCEVFRDEGVAPTKYEPRPGMMGGVLRGLHRDQGVAATKQTKQTKQQSGSDPELNSGIFNRRLAGASTVGTVDFSGMGQPCHRTSDRFTTRKRMRLQPGPWLANVRDDSMQRQPC